MDLKDLKLGQIVKINEDARPYNSKTRCSESEGEIVFLPSEGTIPNSTSLILRIKSGWKDNSILGDFSSLVYERLRLDKEGEYGGWFVDTENILQIISEPVIKASTKAPGGNCKVCNEFNEYQDGPYICYSHTH